MVAVDGWRRVARRLACPGNIAEIALFDHVVRRFEQFEGDVEAARAAGRESLTLDRGDQMRRAVRPVANAVYPRGRNGLIRTYH
jgi:hypothetical protein